MHLGRVANEDAHAEVEVVWMILIVTLGGNENKIETRQTNRKGSFGTGTGPLLRTQTSIHSTHSNTHVCGYDADRAPTRM